MRYLKYKITMALILGIVILAFPQRYQHQGQTTSYGGGLSEGVGLKSFIVVGEPIIGPFSGGTYTGNAGFMFSSSDCEAPLDVSVNNIASTTATLNWSAVTGADKYEVRYRLQGNIPWTTEEAFTNTLDLTALETGMAYQFQVRTVCVADGSRKSIWTELYEFETLGLATCEVPQNVSGVPTTLGQADISWDAANGATAYEVRWKLSGTTVWVSQTNATASYTISALQSGAEYAVQVRTICSGGLVSPWSPSGLFLSGGDPVCNVPSNVSVSNITLNGAQVSWTTVTEAINGYEIRYRVSSSANWTQATVATSPFDITGLAQGTEYVFLVRSKCDNGLLSSFSPQVVFTTAGVPVCNPVTGISITSNMVEGSTATVNLSWPTDPNGLGYDVRYRIKGSVSFQILQSGTNQATLNNLFTGIEYQASVRKICTFDGSLTSAWSEPFFFVTSGASSCEVPTGLDAIPDEITIDEVTLNWSDVTTTYENYLVQYKVKGSSVSTDVIAADANPLVLTGLAPGLIYQFRVRTICDSALPLQSAWSPYFDFTMFGSPNCQSPPNLILTDVTETTATISWSVAPNAVGYDYRYQTGTAVELGEVATNSVTLENLAPGTGYIFNVRSKCAADGSVVSNYSGSFIFTTNGIPACDTPANVALVTATETTLQLDWDDAAGTLGYEIKFKPSTANVFSTLVAGSSEIVLSSLFSGTSYNIEIRNLCSSGIESLPVIANFSTTGTSACEVPTGLSVAGITETGATVSWIGANNANTTGYYIRWKKVGTNIWNSQSFGGWANSHTLSGLSSGTEYVFQVSRYCLGNVTSDVSVPIYFTTGGSSPCSAPPTNLAVTSLTTTSATVTWDGVDISSDGVNVQLRPDGQLSWIGATFPWKNSHDMSPLTPGTNYTFRVSRACEYPLATPQSDYAIIQFTTPTSLSPRMGSNFTSEGNAENVTGINVYPNPFTDQLSIEFVLEESQFMQIDLLTLNGQVIETILKGETSSGSYRFNAEINDMADGTYLLRFSSDLDTPVFKRIVKQ